jgi:hypothetical protein
MKKKLSKGEVQQIFHEDHEDYELIEKGVWEDEGKYSYKSSIFKDKEGKFWDVSATRSGSYFTHYEWMYEEEIIEVEQTEVLVTQWVAVKD